jgi:hypothetical protein
MIDDPFVAHMERRCGCMDEPLDEEFDDEPTQIERLSFPKFAIVSSEDRLQQLLASAYAQYLIRLEVKA